MQRLNTLGRRRAAVADGDFQETGVGNPNKPRNLAQMLGVSGSWTWNTGARDIDAEDRLKITHLRPPPTGRSRG